MILPVKQRKRKKAGIPLTPLIDIVFLLLIYFLLTTNFLVEEGIKVNLPAAKAAAPQMNTEIIVCVNRQGKTFIGDQEVSLAALFGLLNAKIGTCKDQRVVVKADREVVLDAAVKVMDVARAAGAERLLLATEREF